MLVFLSLVIDSKESMWLRSFFFMTYEKNLEKVLYSIIEIIKDKVTI